MKISFTKLGAIGHAEVEIGNLTLICGENNTGKTYVTYGVYGFLAFWHSGFRFPLPDRLWGELRNTGMAKVDLEPYVRDPADVLRAACLEFQERLPRVFAAPKSRFSETQIVVDVPPRHALFDEPFERSITFGDAQLDVAKAKGSYEIVVTVVAGDRRPSFIPPSAIRRVGDAVKEALFRDSVPRPFVISSERTGAAMFKGELNPQSSRWRQGPDGGTDILERGSDESRARVEDPDELDEESRASLDDPDEFDVLGDVSTDYPLPIKANIQFARKRESILTEEGFIWKAHRDVLAYLENVIGGEFELDDAGVFRFIPEGTNLKLSMDESSSCVRSLVDLRLYLGGVANQGALLIIDEPEANLHPRNQRRIARMLPRLVRLGLRVLVTTHSDYIVKELNLLILMNSSDERVRKLAEREKYLPQEALDPADVKLYVTRAEPAADAPPGRPALSTNLVSVPVSAENGIEIESFDREIESLNSIQDELLWG
jgi:hypothetical protein